MSTSKKLMNLNRRQMLQGLLGGGAGLSALWGLGGSLHPFSPLARAAGSDLKDRNFIFCYFSGGWDGLLALDPRDTALFSDDRVTDTLINTGYGQLESVNEAGNNELISTSVDGMVFGPYIGKLADHADKLSVVRGMSMETLTHQVGYRRFLTGKPPSGLSARGSSAATWLASYLGEDELIANLSVQVESYNVDQPTFASALKVGSVSDLIVALQAQETALSPLAKRQIRSLLTQFGDCPRTSASPYFLRALENKNRAIDLVDENLDVYFDFQSSGMADLRSRYGIASNDKDLDSAAAQAAMAVQAISLGLTRCVSIRLGRSLDTHYDEWATDQGPNQEEGFNLLATMVDHLEEEGLLEKTTIIAFSEFQRSSLLNATGGRDHSLTNSCLLVGGDIAGGKVIGRSSDVGMEPTYTNLQTGEPDSSGEVVRPEHILRALFTSVGIEEDVADLRVDPLTALLHSE